MTEGRVANDRQDYRHRRLSPSHVSLRAQVRPSHSSLQAQLREIFSRWESCKSTRSKFPRTATLASQMLTEAELMRDMRCRHAVAFPRLVRMPIAIVTSVWAAVTTTKRPFGNTSASKATVERAEVRSPRERDGTHETCLMENSFSFSTWTSSSPPKISTWTDARVLHTATLGRETAILGRETAILRKDTFGQGIPLGKGYL